MTIWSNAGNKAATTPRNSGASCANGDSQDNPASSATESGSASVHAVIESSKSQLRHPRPVSLPDRRRGCC
jgi:hypothetical protein